MRGLAYRRHQEQRHKERTRKVLRLWNVWSWDGGEDPEPDARQVGIHANHGLPRCSCPLCSPVRAVDGPPHQELRAEPAPE